MLVFLGFILFGLVVGAIARLLTPGRGPGGLVATMLIGVLGSLVGGLIGQYGLGRGAGYTPGWIMSVVGAALLVLAYRRLWRGDGPR